MTDCHTVRIVYHGLLRVLFFGPVVWCGNRGIGDVSVFRLGSRNEMQSWRRKAGHFPVDKTLQGKEALIPLVRSTRTNRQCLVSVRGLRVMHVVSRLRRVLAMMTILLGLLAGLGVASANAADTPVLTGGGGSSDPSRS